MTARHEVLGPASVLEWLWHVDEQDEPVGAIARDMAHGQQVRHRSGIVFLVDADRRVYLTRRATSKALFPGCYDSSASFHVSYGEQYAEAAAREAHEELGVALPLTPLGKFRHDDPPERQFVAVFGMRYTGEALTLDPAEASQGWFVPIVDVARIVREQPCTPWLRDGLPLLRAWLR